MSITITKGQATGAGFLLTAASIIGYTAYSHLRNFAIDRIRTIAAEANQDQRQGQVEGAGKAIAKRATFVGAGVAALATAVGALGVAALFSDAVRQAFSRR